MKITEIYIKSFGKLKGVKINPISGVNIIYGENEAGKSTIMEFILGMFYGLGKGEKRHKYEPWGGGRMAGIIQFEHEGIAYQLGRQFGVTRAADKIDLWNTTSGSQISLPEKAEPGEYILKINRESFINSVFIGQAGTAVKGDNNEILAKLTNLAASGDETASKSEISARLTEAAACLRSKRTTAIIPALEKERLELLEERAKIIGDINSADVLREDITRLSHRCERLKFELDGLEEQSGIAAELKNLREMEDVIAKYESVNAAKEKYEKLHGAMFEGESAISDEFLEDTRAMLDDYKEQQVVIKMKQEQLEACDTRLESIDRSCMANYPTVRKYSREISQAFEDYSDLRAQRIELERALEENSKPTVSGFLTPQNIILAGVVLVALMLIIGFFQPAFFIVAAIIAAILGVYMYFQKKGVSFEGMPKENIEFQNIDNDMRAINRSMRPILDSLGCSNMEDLDRELHHMDTVQNQITQANQEKEKLLEDIDAQRQSLRTILDSLKEKLAPFKEVQSDTEALKIISALDKAQRDHAVFETQYRTELEAYTIALAGRDIDIVILEADELREKLAGSKISKEAAAHLVSDDLDEELKKIREDYDRSKTELVQKETQLSMQSTGSQDLNRINEQIKLLTEKIEQYDFEYSAICEAQAALDDAFESMQKDFGPMINFRAGKILDELTAGKYSSCIISESLVPSIAEQGGSDIRSCFSMSSGTVDQIYLALRLAIAGILTTENLPFIMDDALAQFDDKRLTDALYYLGKENGTGAIGQVILFTCHGRVLFAAKETGLLDGVVRLP
ncbi:MAG: AAA family ATPase [Clostridia bacterium]|nr:AAA family ATPase [Clostridia bacterium]